jgi:hypothetical protein
MQDGGGVALRRADLGQRVGRRDQIAGGQGR